MSRASTSRAMPPPPITARRTTAHVLDDAQREAISGIDSGSAIDYASLFRVPEEASRASRPAVKAATAPAPSRAAPDTPPRPSVTEMLDAVRTTPGKRVGSALAGLDPSMLAAIQNMAAREKAAQDDEEEQEEQEEAKRAPRAGAKKAPSAARKSLGAPKAIQDEVAPAPARRKPTAATAAPARRVTRSRARAEEPEPTVLAGDEEEEEEEEQATSAPVRSRQSFGASAAVAASAARVRTPAATVSKALADEGYEPIAPLSDLFAFDSDGDAIGALPSLPRATAAASSAATRRRSRSARGGWDDIVATADTDATVQAIEERLLRSANELTAALASLPPLPAAVAAEHGDAAAVAVNGATGARVVPRKTAALVAFAVFAVLAAVACAYFFAGFAKVARATGAGAP